MKKYAFVLVKVEKNAGPMVIRRLKEIKEIREIFMITGPFDLLVVIETSSYERIGEIIVEEVQKIKGIKNTQTLMAFKTYKYIEK